MYAQADMPDTLSSTHRSRVTLDYDSYHDRWRFTAIRAYHELDQIADTVEVRVSSSGEGIHLIGWFTDRLSRADQLRLRRHLGDDQNRVRLDTVRTARGHTGNVLWSEKTGNDGTPTEYPDIYEALDAIEMARERDLCESQRLTNLQRHVEHNVSTRDA